MFQSRLQNASAALSNGGSTSAAAFRDNNNMELARPNSSSNSSNAGDDAAQVLDRVAYVVDKAWMSSAIGLVDAITPMHIRAFGTEESDQAREWLLS